MTRALVLERWRVAETLLEMLSPTASPEHVAWLRSVASEAFDEYIQYLDGLGKEEET